MSIVDKIDKFLSEGKTIPLKAKSSLQQTKFGLLYLTKLKEYGAKSPAELNDTQKKKLFKELAQASGNKMELFNQNVHVTFNVKDKEINARDQRDRANEPVSYTKSKQGLDKTWLDILTYWSDETKYFDIGQSFTKNGLNWRSYCAVD